MSGEERLPEAIEHLLRQVDRRWRVRGLPAAERAELLADIGADLHVAHLRGTPLETITGADPVAFADEVADVLGHPPAGRSAAAAPALDRGARYGRLLLGAGLAGAAATVVGLVFFLPATLWLSQRLPVRNGVVPLAVYAVFGVFFTASVLAGVRWALTDAARLVQTLARAAVLVPASALLTVPTAVVIGGGSGFSWAPQVLFAEFAVVVAGVVAALLLARSWALGRPWQARATT